jgi:hypothetical protein
VSFEPVPNPYNPGGNAPNAASANDPKYRYNPGLLWDPISVAGDWVPLKGVMSHDHGISKFSLATPKPVCYSILATRYPQFAISLEQLSAQGLQLDTQPGYPMTLKVGLSVAGGGPIQMDYVAELLALGLSDQGQDDGLGNFRVQASTVATKHLTSQEWWRLQQKSKGRAPYQPESEYDKAMGDITEVTSDLWPGGHGEWVNIPYGPGGIVCYPNWVVGAWGHDPTTGKLTGPTPNGGTGQFDNLGMAFTVFRQHEVPWWEDIVNLAKIVYDFVKTVVAVVKGVYEHGFGLVGLPGELYNDITALAQDCSSSKLNIPREDTWGYLAFASSADWGFGLASKDEDRHEFYMSGAADQALTDMYGEPGPAGTSRANISHVKGNPAHSAFVAMRMSRVPALYSWCDVQLLEFTVSQFAYDFDPSTVYLSTKRKPGSATPSNWKAGDPIPAVPGNSEALPGKGGTPDGYRFKVRDPARPYNYHVQGSMLVPNTNSPGEAWTTRSPAVTSFDMGVWCTRPGWDDPLGRVSWTFYHDDIRKNFGKPPVTADQNDGVAITYSKDGPFYVADYVIDNPDGYLKQVKLRVYVYIWEG